MHALLRTHICEHICTQWCIVSSTRAARRPLRVGASAGPRERGGVVTHSCFRLGQSTAAGSAASSVVCASLRANRAAAPGGSGPPPDARQSAARASHERAGLGCGRRPATPPPPHPTPRGAAPAPGAAAPRAAARRRHRRKRARRRGGGRGTHSSSKSLHRPSDSGSTFTFVRAINLPEHRTRVRPRPPRNDGQTWGRTGRSHAKETTHARASVCLSRACA